MLSHHMFSINYYSLNDPYIHGVLQPIAERPD
jgi:hypothetical protein